MTLQALYDQAVAAHRAGHLADAERLYLQLLQTAPSSFGPPHMLGVLRAQQGDNDEALDLIGRALVQQPDAAARWTSRSGWR